MAEKDLLTCGCNDRAEATWSYCRDDFFCPRCGTAVTRLISGNRFSRSADRGVICVYPVRVGEQQQFIIPLQVEFADSQRKLARRAPQVDLEKSTGVASQFFSSKLTLLDRPNNPGTCLIRLVPLSNENDPLELPAQGIRHKLSLRGDFRETNIDLLVGRTPSLRVELIGRGVEPAGGADSQKLNVTSSELLHLTVVIHAEQAPVIITDELDTNAVTCIPIGEQSLRLTGAVPFRMQNSLKPGTELIPGTPWTTLATLDSTELQEGDRIQLSFTKLKKVVAHSFDNKSLLSLQLELERVEKGLLDIDPNPLTIPVMYLGELRSNAPHHRLENPDQPAEHDLVVRRVLVRNQGKDAIVLEVLEPRHEMGFEWIRADWSTDIGEGSVRGRNRQVSLAHGQQAELYLRIDLRDIQLKQLPVGRSLSANVPIRHIDGGEESVVRLVIGQVLPREECPNPLCIDFGNTSSFAALRHPKAHELSHMKGDLLSVHEVRKPESFPTALFFHSVGPGTLDIRYEIGDLAVDAAKRNAADGGHATLVTDLKRWIDQPGHTKTVIDADGIDRACDVPMLIRLYIRALIARAEAILRKYSIRRICLSHPSKFTLRQRERFIGIIDQLCDEVTQERDGIPLERVPDDVDEANAVAVGSVFEVDIHRDHLKPIVTRQTPHFVVASFDLGGGSLDTALIRFRVKNGNINFPHYTTEYLGIGGHETFGGDNVTQAVFELLLARIDTALTDAGLSAASCLGCVPSPRQKDSADRQRRQNYAVLWEASELIKISLCQHNAVTCDSEPYNALKDRVRTLLIDLELDASAGGLLRRHEEAAKTLQQLVESGQFLVSLEDIYGHALQHDLAGREPGYTVRQRVEESVAELVDFALLRETSVDLVVLCGAGSHLPLVRELIAEKLKNAAIIQDPARTKHGVACGLVRFLEAASGKHQFARSSEYTISEFGVGNLEAMPTLASCIPNCVSVRAERWYPLRDPETQCELLFCDLGVHADRVWVYRQNRGHPPVRHGWFDLTQPPDESAGGAGQSLAPNLCDGEFDAVNNEGDVVATVRLSGSEHAMQMKIDRGQTCLGIWTLHLCEHLS